MTTESINLTYIDTNLRVLLQALLQPEARDINLTTWRQACGTIHCVVGLATTLQHFQDLGWFIHRYNDQLLEIHTSLGAWDSVNSGIFDSEFGPMAFQRLFAGRSEGAKDYIIPHNGMSDRDLAIFRLCHALEDIKSGDWVNWGDVGEDGEG